MSETICKERERDDDSTKLNAIPEIENTVHILANAVDNPYVAEISCKSEQEEEQEEYEYLLPHLESSEVNMNVNYYHVNDREVESEEHKKSHSNKNDMQITSSVVELERTEQLLEPINIATIPDHNSLEFSLNVSVASAEPLNLHHKDIIINQVNNDDDDNIIVKNEQECDMIDSSTSSHSNEEQGIKICSDSETKTNSCIDAPRYEQFVHQIKCIAHECYITLLDNNDITNNKINLMSAKEYDAYMLPALRVQEIKKLSTHHCSKHNKTTSGNNYNNNNNNNTEKYTNEKSENEKECCKCTNVNSMLLHVEGGDYNNNNNISDTIVTTSPHQALCSHIKQHPRYGTSESVTYNKNSRHSFLNKCDYSNSSNSNFDISCYWNNRTVNNNDDSDNSGGDNHVLTLTEVRLFWHKLTWRQFLFCVTSFLYITLLFTQCLLCVMESGTIGFASSEATSSSSSSSSKLNSMFYFMQPTHNIYIDNAIESTQLYKLERSTVTTTNTTTTNNNNHGNKPIYLFRYHASSKITLLSAIILGTMGLIILFELLTCGFTSAHLRCMPHILLMTCSCMTIAGALLNEQGGHRSYNPFTNAGVVFQGCGIGLGLMGSIICAMMTMGVVAGMSVQFQIMLLAWITSSVTSYMLLPTSYFHHDNAAIKSSSSSSSSNNNNNTSIIATNKSRSAANNNLPEFSVIHLPLYMACASLVLAFALICLIHSRSASKNANKYKRHIRTHKLITSLKNVSICFVLRGLACVLLISIISIASNSCYVLFLKTFNVLLTTPEVTSVPSGTHSLTSTQFNKLTIYPFELSYHSPVIFETYKQHKNHNTKNLFYSTSTLSSTSSSSLLFSSENSSPTDLFLLQNRST